MVWSGRDVGNKIKSNEMFNKNSSNYKVCLTLGCRQKSGGKIINHNERVLRTELHLIVFRYELDLPFSSSPDQTDLKIKKILWERG